jgi:hypothetical protein
MKNEKEVTSRDTFVVFYNKSFCENVEDVGLGGNKPAVRIL